MNRYLRIMSLALLAFGAAASASAKDSSATYLRAAPTSLSPNSAYLLMRVSTAKSGLFTIQQVLLRIPSPAELDAYRTAKKAAYDAALPSLTKKAKGEPVLTFDQFAFEYRGEPNSFVVEHGKFLEDGEMRTVLMQVPAGSYVVYGIANGGRALLTCNWLGTVRFAAPAGVITDVGSLYADKVHKPSPVPHLEDNLGSRMGDYGFMLGGCSDSLRRFHAATSCVEGPEDRACALQRCAAVCRARHAVHKPLGAYSGLLGYERGKPVDLRTGKQAD